jgi:hypothetical protein
MWNDVEPERHGQDNVGGKLRRYSGKSESPRAKLTTLPVFVVPTLQRGGGIVAPFAVASHSGLRREW